MKVGTDGTLLGAWAQGGRDILDIGTGTGLIALMMAQRFGESRISGIDIDPMAVEQAKDNVARSPFADRIMIAEADANTFQGTFDCIVSNPPFFERALECPDIRRNMARHTNTLTYASLFATVKRLLASHGVFSLIVPFDYLQRCIEEATLTGFFLSRQWAVKTNSRKPPRRYLMAFTLHSVERVDTGTGIIEDAPGYRSDWYGRLTDDFYLPAPVPSYRLTSKS